MSIAAAGRWVALGIALAALASAEPGARIRNIEDAVLAPCCYTEPVSRHQSEAALRMRVEIAKWVAEGRSDREILDAYVQRYGNKVLVDPRTIPGAWIVWVPWLAAVFAIVLGFWILKRWRARPLPAAGPYTVELPDFDDEE